MTMTQSTTRIVVRHSQRGNAPFASGRTSAASGATCSLARPASAAALLCIAAICAPASAQCGGPWVQISPPVSPEGRDNIAMTYDSARQRVVLFAGIRSVNGPIYYRDTWELDGTTWTQRATTGPSATHFAPLAFDAARGVTVLFGGRNGASASFLNQTWLWNGSQWTQAAVQGPSARGAHVLAYDPIRAKVLLFGGQGIGGALLGDTWEWDGAAWTSIPTPAPSPIARRYAQAAFYPPRGKIVLYGGLGSSGVRLGDMWEWAGDHWEQIAQNGPPRVSHAMAADATSLLVFGGADPVGQGIQSTMIFRNGAWTEYTGLAPRARSTTMAYDQARGRFMIFSGYTLDSPQNPADTWAFPTAIDIAQGPVSATVCPGADATFTVIARGDGPISHQWQIQTAPATWTPFGIGPLPLPCGGEAIASTPQNATTQILISPCAGVTNYQVRCVASNACGSVPSNPAVYAVCYANCDCSLTSPALNTADYICFLNKYAAGDSSANCDGSTSPPTMNVADFICFLNSFAAGCP
ncbi:MAG: GC-type dockerin domain-anchored protein [Phycisphaerales bacterium]